jgi:septum formation protein
MVKQINSQIVILASRSPRRVELLKQIGIDSIVRPADVDESSLVGESPADYVQRVARQKVIAIAKSLKSEYAKLPVLAADTTVALNGEILGKPENDADAFNMLKKLSASKHAVHTAVAVSLKNKVKVILSTTMVEMMPLTDAMIKAYVETGEQRDKAGSYAIQGKAGAWVARIDGSYTGVMGLPLYETAKLLNEISN